MNRYVISNIFLSFAHLLVTGNKFCLAFGGMASLLFSWCLFLFLCFCLMCTFVFFVWGILPVAASFRGHGSEATTPRIYLVQTWLWWIFFCRLSFRILVRGSSFGFVSYFHEKNDIYIYIWSSSFCRSVFRVWHEHEAELSRKRDTSVLWVAPKGMGIRGGATVVGKQRLTKTGKRRQTG